MKSAMRVVAVSLLVLSSRALAADVDVDGATVGKWTMDFDAARALAKEKRLPVLINITGSDWCGWCKLMDKNVFSKQEWLDHAADNLVLVYIDFPKDAKLVPQKYVARNQKLKDEYGAQGFPTYIVLDGESGAVLAMLGAGQEKTPKSFIAEIASATRYTAASVARFTKGLTPAKRREYMEIVDRIAENSESKRAEEERIKEAQARIAELEEKAAELKWSATEFRASLKGPEKLKECRRLRTELEAAEQKLKDWLATGPQQTPENMKKYRSMAAEIGRLRGELDEY